MMYNIIIFWLMSISPAELANKIDSVSSYPYSSGIMEETIITTSNKKRTFKIKYFSMDGNKKQLMVYIFPPVVKGNGFLMIGNNIWAYFPETGRVRKIASHARRQRMMGSDFTYEDMSIGDYKKKFTPSRVEERTKFYLLTLIPTKKSGISYGKLILRVDKKTYIPLQIDFYRPSEEKPYKTLFQKNIKIIDSIPTPIEIEMVNNETSSSTEIKMIKVDYRSKLKSDFFSIDKLKAVSE